MNELEAIIRQRIREKGPVPFRDFMEWALYFPELGYYQRQRDPFGKSGDFYTAPTVHPVFGETIARDLVSRWEQLDRPVPCTVLECGAGRGTLAKQILDAIRDSTPELYAAVEYRIWERSTSLRVVQQTILQGQPVDWISDVNEIAPFTGIVLSNELIDAMPVHVVAKSDKCLQELYVTEQNGQLAEWWGPVSDERIVPYLQQFAPPLKNRQRAEVNLAALEWLALVARALATGWIITIDYGEQAELLYEGRMHGTLRAYRQHQFSPSLLRAVGEQDITADVNFTALMQSGEALGLQTVFYGTQARFLVEAGIFQLLSPDPAADPFRDDRMKRNLAVKHLVLPGGMGECFKVLVQRKMA
ncbi:class I SAM-dependent methyltransferase [Effusibacillus pohliae]|uniref:class I SAM-dependent methyltransferase n=1 Tax=Effusibacillus pohliae TaxID=232270 RepID=UPI0003827BB9|nr:SAM-dependent methyltransferase [Effusibacillus pohliae]